MKTREEIASSIERSIGTAIPTLFFSDDDLQVIVVALREQRPEANPSDAKDAARYWYLREHGLVDAVSVVHDEFHGVAELMKGEALDAAIDALLPQNGERDGT